jgi:hypothetical protein
VHKLEIWAYNYLVSMPGDSGVGPGFIVIKSKDDHRLLKRYVDSAHDLAVPEWMPNSVEIEREGKWELNE